MNNFNSRMFRRTRLKGWYEYYRTPCPICGHVGGCIIHESGDRVACIRIESKIPFSKNSALPSYLHLLKPRDRQKIEKIEVEDMTPKKDDSTLDLVYRTMMEFLEVNEDHYAHLRSKRKLTDQQVMIREYKSFPDKPWEVARWVGETLGMDDFTGIPGFYLRDEKYWTLSGTYGILIPFRNQRNQIVGFQYRIDNPPNVVEVKVNKSGWKARIKEQPDLVQVISEDGEILFEGNVPISKSWKTISTEKELLGWIRVAKGNRYYWLSSVNKPKGTGTGNPAPVHIAVPSKQLANWQPGTLHKTKAVWLIEGPLKADISADCIEKLYTPAEIEQLGSTLLALPGAGAWRLANPILKEMGVENVNICFDADAISNPHVKKHVLECAKSLKKDGFHANLILWQHDNGKGLDDLFLAGYKPHVKRLF